MTHAFSTTGIEITDALLACFTKDGIVSPTPVQEAAIPPVLAGKDIVIQAGTGTGKTLAYLLPLLERARHRPEFRVVILAPSPELAMQILRTVEAYKPAGVSSTSLVGSGKIDRQKDKLKKHPQILVGTPGRVIDMIYARKVKTDSIRALVFDEIDQILSEQNDQALRDICSRPEFKSQIIVASATFGRHADNFANDFMVKDRVRLQLTASPLRQNIRHHFAFFANERTEAGLVHLLEELAIEAALVFVHKGYNIAKLYNALKNHNIPCATLSATGNSQQRQDALTAFKKREVRVLVATDTAARGIDIRDLNWVIHYELANDYHSYLHRAGRTGRAGKNGTSVVMITRDELPDLERQARELRIEFTPLPVGDKHGSDREGMRGFDKG